MATSFPPWTDEHDMIRRTVRKFAEERLYPHRSDWDKAGEYPAREVFQEMAELGLLGIKVDPAYGGIGLDWWANTAFCEELSWCRNAGVVMSILVNTDMATGVIDEIGTHEQKEEFLAPVIRGEKIAALGVSEPGAGSDVAGITTKAVRDGNGWRLNGSKVFITNGATADVLFVGAKTDTNVKGSRGISIFIVPRDTPGFSVARTLDKTGWRSSDTAELVFEDAYLPGDALLGEENRGFYAIMDNFQNERLTLGAMSVGMAMAGIELTLDWVKQRQAFGKTLWDVGAIRQRLSMAAAEVEASRQLLWHAAWLDAEGQDCVREVSMVKALTGEMVNRVLYECTQFFGGMGFMRENPVERLYRDARVMSIGGGATEVMLEEVAKRL